LSLINILGLVKCTYRTYSMLLKILPCALYSIQVLSQYRLGRSVKLLLVFVSTVIPGFSLLEIYDQYFCSPLDVCMFLRRGKGQPLYVDATFVAPQFQHEYIRAVTASRSLLTLCASVTALY
jgi:hypothetical protein